jgi:hypothetical protein
MDLMSAQPLPESLREPCLQRNTLPTALLLGQFGLLLGGKVDAEEGLDAAEEVQTGITAEGVCVEEGEEEEKLVATVQDVANEACVLRLLVLVLVLLHQGLNETRQALHTLSHPLLPLLPRQTAAQCRHQLQLLLLEEVLLVFGLEQLGD